MLGRTGATVLALWPGPAEQTQGYSFTSFKGLQIPAPAPGAGGAEDDLLPEPHGKRCTGFMPNIRAATWGPTRLPWVEGQLCPWSARRLISLFLLLPSLAPLSSSKYLVSIYSVEGSRHKHEHIVCGSFPWETHIPAGIYNSDLKGDICNPIWSWEETKVKRLAIKCQNQHPSRASPSPGPT